MNNKKVLRSALIGFVLLLAGVALTAVAGFAKLIGSGTESLNNREFNYGLINSIKNYVLIWQPNKLNHEVAYYGQVFVIVAAILTLVLIIVSLAKKKTLGLLPALFLGLAIAYLPFMLVLVVPMVQLDKLNALGLVVLSGATGLAILAVIFEAFAIKEVLKEDAVIVREEKKEQPTPAGLSEKEVRAIVEKYLKEHVEEKHSKQQPAPVIEPEPEPEEEEPEEEEPEFEEEPAEDNTPAGIANKGKRRRSSFETRLRNSEFDIRHKYYDLRDYIRWYGLKNRVSIPGDTFSYKRQRYVFVTIVGKHIRVYIGLNPADYADSTIPVEAAEAKKYEDLPCLLRVKSDLSYRRAKKLVDDLMAKIGVERPEGEEPKETQEE